MLKDVYPPWVGGWLTLAEQVCGELWAISSSMFGYLYLYWWIFSLSLMVMWTGSIVDMYSMQAFIQFHSRWPWNRKFKFKCLYWLRIYICKYEITMYEITMNIKQTNTPHTYILHIWTITSYTLTYETWKTTRRAMPMACHVLQCLRNAWELVAAIHHRMRKIVSLVKMSCNVQCNVQLTTDGHLLHLHTSWVKHKRKILLYHIQHIYNNLYYNIIYSKHSIGIATKIKSLTSFIELYIGNTSFGCDATAAILKILMATYSQIN